ncbi:hypothetical protein JDS72_28640, partial [Bacillus cereus]|nr:hypothetical protein [Bacillus cereus]
MGNLKRLGVTALTLGMLSGVVLPSDSYAAKADTTKVQAFKSNMPEKAKILNLNDTKQGKQYLTDAEVKSINLNDLTAIYEEVKNAEISKSTDELNQLVAEKIKNNQSVSYGVAAYSDYEIPGFGKLTDAEVNL